MKLNLLLGFVIVLLFPTITLAQSPTIQKRIEVNLSSQQLFAYEGDKLVYEFVISSGKPWWPTPTGEFKPWLKLSSQRMIGGSRDLGTYYDLPNVPYVVYFYKSYALHGTYWHNNFGIPMSHGCVNLKTSDMSLLYPWIEPNATPIKIYGVTPPV